MVDATKMLVSKFQNGIPNELELELELEWFGTWVRPKSL